MEEHLGRFWLLPQETALPRPREVQRFPRPRAKGDCLWFFLVSVSSRELLLSRKDVHVYTNICLVLHRLLGSHFSNFLIFFLLCLSSFSTSFFFFSLYSFFFFSFINTPFYIYITSFYPYNKTSLVDNWPWFGLRRGPEGELLPDSGIDVSIISTLSQVLNFT